METTANNTITALHSETATSYIIEPTATLQEVLGVFPEAVAQRYEIEFNNFHGVDRIYMKSPAWTTFEQGKIDKVYVSEYSVEIYAGRVVFILKCNVTDVQIVLL
jgi:hypothetical protein